ncbi:conjugative transposon protein TraM [Bacteroidales bacterium OttesenSCG-928-K03]|nr:conjugative transposon protein TraM [Bacteroidales bacterium OttesenSCG-928-L14]MDL2240172.1 conjugative transposon protein TraM [Bacteroidales bacterium OttesenSCG-928-K22]MDL2242473.1 conjugative transposon protein TraM [Bacteroidales bacterium OttesenSCG-928-K03]
MEQNLNNIENTTQKKQLSPSQLQKRKKMIIFPIMILAFIGCMWLIFAPSSKDTEISSTNGFNADIPLAHEETIILDKKTAYEQEQVRIKQQEKIRTLQDFSFMLSDESSQKDDLSLLGNDSKESKSYNKSGVSNIQSSANAYKDINRQLEDFYKTPEKVDPKKDELAKKIELLESRLEVQDNIKMSVDDQFAILERSYELASKYTNNANQQSSEEITPVETPVEKAPTIKVKGVTPQIVSTLQTDVSLETLLDDRPRNFGFQTAVGVKQSQSKNTIKACIHNQQTVTSGQNVRLRLLEALQVGEFIIPQNEIISATARIQGERLDIIISSLEYNGNIIPVELSVYDCDGQKGLYVPSSLEREALNEAMANIGSGMGTSFTVNQDAKSAIITDVTRSVLQGGSQYLSKKLRTAKITLKADYQVMLYNNK